VDQLLGVEMGEEWDPPELLDDSVGSVVGKRG